jgi:hypothetical protein
MSHLLWNDRGLNLDAADVITFGFALDLSSESLARSLLIIVRFVSLLLWLTIPSIQSPQ